MMAARAENRHHFAMSKKAKTLDRVMCGECDRNIEFNDLVSLLQALGFSMRIRGGHYIFDRTGVLEIINLQPSGHHAKGYQVKQVREIVLRYGLSL